MMAEPAAGGKKGSSDRGTATPAPTNNTVPPKKNNLKAAAGEAPGCPQSCGGTRTPRETGSSRKMAHATPAPGLQKRLWPQRTEQRRCQGPTTQVPPPAAALSNSTILEEARSLQPWLSTHPPPPGPSPPPPNLGAEIRQTRAETPAAARYQRPRGHKGRGGGYQCTSGGGGQSGKRGSNTDSGSAGKRNRNLVL